MSFRVGSRVIIVDTANVLARCPELVGSVGADPRPWTHHANFAPGAPERLKTSPTNQLFKPETPTQARSPRSPSRRPSGTTY